MRGERAVAILPRQRCVRQVANRTIEHRIGIALDDDARQAHARDLERADRLADAHACPVSALTSDWGASPHALQRFSRLAIEPRGAT